MTIDFCTERFRPLSWGLSFNGVSASIMESAKKVFSSPFLGTFFQCLLGCLWVHLFVFSSPFLGTFFQSALAKHLQMMFSVFVPFLGDFLSMCLTLGSSPTMTFSSPFLGTFFQSPRDRAAYRALRRSFSSPFLGTFFQ